MLRARHRILAVAGALLLGFRVAVAGTAAPTGVQILEHKGRWESGYGETFYNVVGRFKNATGKTLQFVKLRVELLDAHAKVVAKSDAYNETAEGLSVPDLDPKALLASGKIAPVEKDQEQRFRTSFIKDETPPFESYRVRVMEAPPAKAR